MDTLVFIYFIIAILLIIASIAFAFIWLFYEQQETNYWLQENAKEEREKLTKQFLDQMHLAQKERKDLYDRLQAGTLPQYKQHVDEENNNLADTENEDILDIEDAKDELMGIKKDNTNG